MLHIGSALGAPARRHCGRILSCHQATPSTRLHKSQNHKTMSSRWVEVRCFVLIGGLHSVGRVEAVQWHGGSGDRAEPRRRRG